MSSQLVNPANPYAAENFSDRQNQMFLVFARLFGGGLKDDQLIGALKELTKLFEEDPDHVKNGEPSIFDHLDDDCLDTMMRHHDLRESNEVRKQTMIATAAFLKASGERGANQMRQFFYRRMKRRTYDDYIICFCAAAGLFPIAGDFMADLFLHEGFLYNLGNLMNHKWKSRKVETALLEMLRVACYHPVCLGAIRKYCLDWLEEMETQPTEEAVAASLIADPDFNGHTGSIARRRHCEHVKNLAGLVLLHLWSASPEPSSVKPPESQKSITPKSDGKDQAIAKIEGLSARFIDLLLQGDSEDIQHSIEGIAYATLQPSVREALAHNSQALRRLVEVLKTEPPKSPTTYAGLSIFEHLTAYKPVQTEEQKRLQQLRAYANAAGKLLPNPLNDDAHVEERCKLVFEAGVTPVLITHGKNGSPAALSLVVSILGSLAKTSALRGQLAQQGAVRLLISAWEMLPDSNTAARRRTAEALARILISINPALVFRQMPQTAAVRPLATLLRPDPDAEVRNLLPTFESLLALTNLASTDNETRKIIVRTSWDDVEELLFSNNARICTATTELICNLVQSPDEAAALFGDGTTPGKAENRIKIIVALADAEDVKTRSAAGGALASLTCHESVVRRILGQPRGVANILGLCRDDDEGLRHRGAVVVQNMVAHEGEVGKLAREGLTKGGAVQALTECAKKSRSAEVVQAVVGALEVLLKAE
ncbi:hypothetical protein VTJ83DRAFT_6618 [Remersonia thermophila]|uniref:UNC-45/Cro1/She4 central domain-containing protein n=1 Tax=Remersonia thermophila TaxID=72144 RepID=A0ABR4D578_9PEZI